MRWQPSDEQQETDPGHVKTGINKKGRADPHQFDDSPCRSRSYDLPSLIDHGLQRDCVHHVIPLHQVGNDGLAGRHVQRLNRSQQSNDYVYVPDLQQVGDPQNGQCKYQRRYVHASGYQ